MGLKIRLTQGPQSNARMRAHTQAQIHTHACTHTHRHTFAFTHTSLYALIKRKHTQPHTHTHIHTNPCSHKRLKGEEDEKGEEGGKKNYLCLHSGVPTCAHTGIHTQARVAAAPHPLTQTDKRARAKDGGDAGGGAAASNELQHIVSQTHFLSVQLPP